MPEYIYKKVFRLDKKASVWACLI